MEFSHIPVLLEQAVDALAVKENGIYVDGTAGGGGHSSEILSRLTTGKLISIDQDPDAILTLTERFKKNENSIIIKGNFADMVSLLHSRGVGRVDGVLLDIGVSSHQLDTAERGFSFHEDAPLDMRMSQSGTTAAELVNTLPIGELRRILSVYGEEKFARKIVENICARRSTKRIVTTGELVEIIDKSIPYKFKQNGHPAKKTFQAIRIEVNEELDGLGQAVKDIIRGLKSGGRIAILTFHSLEDRIVKQTFKDLETDCICDKRFPVCVCGKKKEIEIITKKPIEASEEELELNSRSRSAKLRIAEKI